MTQAFAKNAIPKAVWEAYEAENENFERTLIKKRNNSKPAPDSTDDSDDDELSEKVVHLVKKSKHKELEDSKEVVATVVKRSKRKPKETDDVDDNKDSQDAGMVKETANKPSSKKASKARR